MPSIPAPSVHRHKPFVLMSMGRQDLEGHAYQVMTHKYLQPLIEIADCLPLLVPSCLGTDKLQQYLDLVDGIFLTGAGSNIEPGLYGQANQTPSQPQDQDRDWVDMALIRESLARQLPLFGVCRGMQEINVAFGGSLYQQLHTEDGMMDHREDLTTPLEEQYGTRHSVSLVRGSWLHRLLGDEIQVNSLHGQGIRELGVGLEALAHAGDGLIEAIHAPGYAHFTLGLQWHPEWQAHNNPDAIKIFQAFGEACRHRSRGANDA